MSRGFTLIEIIMVLLLVAIMAAVVIPRLGSHGDRQLEMATKKVVSDIQYARILAMSNRTTQWHRITFDAGTDAYTITNGTGSGVKNPLTQEPAFSVQLNQGEYSGVTILNNFSSTFTYPFGVPNAPDFLTLQSGTAFRNISVIPFTGKIKVN